MVYFYLTIAIIMEVVATSALKASEGFTRLTPSVIVVVGYAVSFYFLAIVLKTVPMGVVYAIWSGIGIVFIGLVGLFLFRQSLDLPAIIGMGMIIAGVVIINLFSNSVGH